MTWLLRSMMRAVITAIGTAACGDVAREDPRASGDSASGSSSASATTGGAGGDSPTGGAGGDSGGAGAKPLDDLGCGRPDALWDNTFVPSQSNDRARIWGSSPDDVWAVGRGEASGYRFDGTTWASGILDLEGFFPTSIGGTSGDDVYVASTSGLVLRREGAGWTIDGDTLPESVLWGFGPGELLSVAPTGAGRRTPSGWTTQPTPPSAALRAVHGSGPTDAFAVGDAGVALHWNGQTWALLSTGTSANLADVWSLGSERAVAVGDGGTILELWPGGAEPWPAQLPEPRAEHPLVSVWADAEGAVFVTTVQDLHAWDGVAWTSRPLDFFDGASSVWGTSRFDVFVGGAQFVVLHCTEEPRRQ